jgi:hypothetical protein
VAGLASAVMFVSAAVLPALGLITGHVSPVPLMAVGLMHGPGTALAAGVVGILALVASGNSVIALGFGVADILPAVIVVALALSLPSASGSEADPGEGSWTTPGTILGWLTGTGLALLGLAALLLSGGDGVQAAVDHGVEQMLDAVAGQAPAEVRAALAHAWGPVLPGMAAAGWLMRAVVSAMLALWLVSRRRWTVRPVPRYAALDLADGLVVLLGGLLLAGWLAPGDVGYVARNGALLAAMPFVLRGLAAVHLAANQTRHAKGLLAAFYVVFVLSSGLAVVAVAGLGLVDHLARRRSRSASRDRQEEE